MRPNSSLAEKTLRLTAAERAALATLSRAPRGLLVSPLARAADLPRTTALATLRRLACRGFATRGQGYRAPWRLVSTAEAAARLHRIADGGLLSTGEARVTSRRGLAGVLDLTREVSSLPVGTRIFAVQGRDVGRSLKLLPKDFLADYHAALKRRKIVMEGVAGRSELAALEKLDRESLESHWGRPTVVHVVPDALLPAHVDYLFLPDVALVIDWQSVEAFRIEGRPVAAALRAWLDLLVHSGEKIDLNARIVEIMKRRR
ncbi:MAG TPA: hypothetical protein VJJ47_03865 [Candidatus Paceibacterota bacterium]